MNNFATSNVNGIDHLDRAILKEVQLCNLQSHAEIGEKVGLSTSSVRRRLERMRKTGVIAKDVSLLNRDMVGVTLIVTVTFAKDSMDIYKRFEAQMKNMTEVGQCYHIAGEKDYLLIVGAPNLQYYEEWANTHIMSNPNIKRHDTIVSYSCKKFDTQLAVS